MGVGIEVPFPVIDSELNKTAAKRETNPSSATNRALVEENRDIPRNMVMIFWHCDLLEMVMHTDSKIQI